MLSHFKEPLKNSHFLLSPTRSLSSLLASIENQGHQHQNKSVFDSIVAQVRARTNDDEVLQSQTSNSIHFSHDLVRKLLYRFKHDWKSSMVVFRLAESANGFKHSPESYDTVVDILGRSRKWDQMRSVIEEMRKNNLVSLNTVSKMMRRFAGAKQWEEAVRTFDELGVYGLTKNTESMNLLLDTLCKENRVEQARSISMELKPHIPPDSHTFNIFIHGWCKSKRVDEALWTIQEMKGYGFRPCVISYSTIVMFYCNQCSFSKVYELFDEMETQGCPPNSVTYTVLMCSLTKADEFDEALNVAERMKLAKCKPDTLFYNCLIHVLGRAGKLKEAVRVFEEEMPNNNALPNTSTYNSMIAMFCHHGEDEKGFVVLEEMKRSEICKPDVQTYYPLLKSCFKRGSMDLLRDLLGEMTNKYHLSRDISSYSLLIHGLCRMDRCDWAYRLFMEMVEQDIKPRYQTCRLLFDEVKLKDMHEEAKRIEELMKKM